MNTQSYLDGSLRPYVSRSDFDLHYPIAYQPEIGIIDTATSQSISQSLPIVQSKIGNTSINSATSRIGIHAFGSKSSALLSKDSSAYGKSVGDLEWSEFFDFNNLKAVLIALSRRFVQGWMKCLVSQPFDVVRILLQVGSFKKNDGASMRPIKARDSALIDDQEEEEEEEDPRGLNYSDSDYEDRNTYFDEPNIDSMRDSKIERTSRKASRKPSGLSKEKANLNLSRVNILLEPESLNTFDMLSALLVKEGPRGALKAVNTTFLMRTLQYTIESWISGFISGLIGIPDPLYVDMVHSPNANWSLILSLVSNICSGLLLTQLRLIRAKFIITTSSRGCRSFREIICNIPKLYIFSIPKALLLPSLVTHFIKSFTLNYPEYFLTSMKINKYNNPYVYNMSSVILKIIGLFVRLPFETLYARAQVNYLLTNRKELPEIMRVEREDMCIEFGGYYGYLSTLYYIVMGSRPLTYEGQSLEVSVEKDEENKGFKAIFRGWKVGLLRLVSSYCLKLLKDERFSINEEKF